LTAALEHLPAYVGGLYVLTGSQFGKRVISRHLQAQQHPLGFSSRYISGDSNPANWKGFLAGASRENIDPEFLALAKEGAADFFSVFLRHWQAAG
jgi:heme oxygenase